MLLSVNVREDIWHFFYGLKLTQKAVRAVLQRQAINCKPLARNALRRLKIKGRCNPHGQQRQRIYILSWNY